MNSVLNLIIVIVALGVGTLFAAFFIVLGLNKKEIWGKIYKNISFK